MSYLRRSWPLHLISPFVYSHNELLCSYGGLAQLARALAWHARGHRFESDILHTASLDEARDL